MLGSLNSGVSGLRQFQTKMNVIGNNIANSNTIAFKAARADFADALSQSLRDTSLGTPTMQVGSGVSTVAIKNNYESGSTASTGVETDLAISGEGFFVVRDTVNDKEYATRAGDFRVSEAGYLVTNSGLRVQGYNDAGLTTRGDILIDTAGLPATSDPTATVDGYSIDGTGSITVKLSDNTEFVRGQILLQKFQNPQALLKEGDSLYSGLAGAGPLGGGTPQTEVPGTNGLGTLQTGRLELSNVDLTEEFANLITTQRGFQACARVITTSDEILTELVNLKR